MTTSWEPAQLPMVSLIACGGTIASIGSTTTDLIDYPEDGTKLNAAALVNRIPEVSAVSRISTFDHSKVGSTDFRPDDWIALRQTILDLRAGPSAPDGIVITHGTATLEETAYFLDLTLPPGAPVVLVGAQRPFGSLSSDAPMNLLAAVRVAVDPMARNRGVLVVMNDRVFLACDVRKCATMRLEAFTSEYGPVATVDCDHICFRRAADVSSGHTGSYPLPPVFVFPRVDIIYSYAGADDLFVKAAVEAGARGIVSAGFAPGMPTRLERLALEAAVTAGIAVVQSSHVGAGRVARRRYLDRAGVISAEGLSPQKARILLGVALGCGASNEQLRQAFRTS